MSRKAQNSNNLKAVFTNVATKTLKTSSIPGKNKFLHYPTKTLLRSSVCTAMLILHSKEIHPTCNAVRSSTSLQTSLAAVEMMKEAVEVTILSLTWSTSNSKASLNC